MASGNIRPISSNAQTNFQFYYCSYYSKFPKVAQNKTAPAVFQRHSSVPQSAAPSAPQSFGSPLPVFLRFLLRLRFLSLLVIFFLSLRLMRWEEGLGRTGYVVACITELQKESSEKKSKNSITVNVGGIKCLVESKNVSNHGFLEDELMAWWSATLKGGGKLPSEDYLKLKIKEKKLLVF